eukprot:UN4443
MMCGPDVEHTSSCLDAWLLWFRLLVGVALLPACMDTVAARVPHCKTALLCAEVVQSVCMVPAALQWACRLVVQRDASQPPRCMGKKSRWFDVSH